MAITREMKVERMIEPLTMTHKSNWVELIDPGGNGTSRVPADRVSHYLEKGFKLTLPPTYPHS